MLLNAAGPSAVKDIGDAAVIVGNAVNDEPAAVDAVACVSVTSCLHRFATLRLLQTVTFLTVYNYFSYSIHLPLL